ncbi:putative bifunctional diguanylate cyclase/phosphodiesterase [Actinoplanes awajinensis]|uniref:putative bifunctional diguanylate cyclase/phosphodiesterase n=1 Tax=Actinoplanes awajinensis TaxID=135946 RepID=UPI0009FEA0D4|nr:EAL domain-containing protein [Actinoplanes awajinensis]
MTHPPEHVVVEADDLGQAGEKLAGLRAAGFTGTAGVLLTEDGARQAARTVQQLQTAIDNIPAPIFSKDADGAYGACNTAFEAYVGVPRERIIGRTVHQIWSPEMADVYAAADQALLDAGGKQVYEAQVRYADGTLHDVTFYKGILTDEHGAVRGLAGAMLDITERRALEDRLRVLADTDPLTGAANRALFTRRLTEAVARAGTQPPAVLLIDLDDFKAVNDSLGHDVGDQFLIAVTARLHDGLGDGDTVARLGGDEFAVLLEDSSRWQVARTVRRITAALGRAVDAGGHPLTPRASIGVAQARPGDSGDDLLRHADIALYEAKDGGKGRYAYHRPGMRTRVVDQSAMLTALRQALTAGRLSVHYQPIVRLDDGQVSGVEALARWRDPARGWVPPTEFVPAAERGGLIAALGEWMLGAVCRRTGPPATYLNTSAHELREPRFADRVAAALATTGLAPSRLIIEVTESAAVEDETVLATLHRVRALGVRIALDDFGTGRSSLSLLVNAPVDVIKLDPAFTARITEDGRHATVARAVARLAGSLGIEAVAKGVETAAQARGVREAGFGLAQGLHVGAPMPGDDLDAYLRDAPEPRSGSGTRPGVRLA